MYVMLSILQQWDWGKGMVKFMTNSAIEVVESVFSIWMNKALSAFLGGDMWQY